MDSHGGTFDLVKNAQLLLVPIENLEPPQLPQSDAGSLAVAITLDERERKIASSGSAGLAVYRGNLTG